MTGLLTLRFGLVDVQESDILARKSVILKLSILTKILLAKKRPKLLGIQRPSSGDDNQSCHILTVLFNQTEQLLIL